MGKGGRLTVRDLILVHLADFAPSEKEFEVPTRVTQAGLAEAARIEQRHVPQYVKPLMAKGLVVERVVHVQGGKQRRKAYFLTPEGREEATRIRGGVLGRTVVVQAPDATRLDLPLGEAQRRFFRGVGLVDLLRSAEEQGFLRGPPESPGVGLAPEAPGIRLALDQAEGRERAYDWERATEIYLRALPAGQDSSVLGSLHERLGYALRRWAFQADESKEFGIRVARALESLGRAREIYAGLGRGGEGRLRRGEATESYLRFWLAPRTAERGQLLNQAWEWAKGAMAAFKEAREGDEFARTFNGLAECAILGFNFAPDQRTRQAILQEGLAFGEEAVDLLATSADKHALAQAHACTAFFAALLNRCMADLADKEACHRRALDHWSAARGLSEETALLGLNHGMSLWGDGTDEALLNSEKAVEVAKGTRDRFLVGNLMAELVYQTSWKAWAVDDNEERRKLFEKALQLAKETQRQLSPLSFTSPQCAQFWPEAPLPWYYFFLGWQEVEQKTKRALLEKALKVAPDSLRPAEASGYPKAIAMAHHVFPLIERILARVVTGSGEKQRLLQDALLHATEALRRNQTIEPYVHWNLGESFVILADIKSQLADLAEEAEAGRKMLEEAVVDGEEGIRLQVKDMEVYGRRGEVAGFGSLGENQYDFGGILVKLLERTGDPACHRRAVAAFEDAATAYTRAGLTSRAAECCWRSAQLLDALGDHEAAGKSFALASSNYKQAAEGIPQLSDFYQDHAMYMQAWSEIERARYHHARQEYGLARECYDKAASLHEFSKRWGFLTLNYQAWARLEEAEDLSRRERGPEAINAFERAGGFFQDAKGPMEAALKTIGTTDEKEMVSGLARAAETRYRYCTSRITLEQAKLLDRRGEPSSSSEKYRLAAEAFEGLAGGARSDQDRRDLKLIGTLARAWEAMARAEAEASPTSFRDAARLFEGAKELSPTEAMKHLALGHARFCRALEAGMGFADAGDEALYTSAVQHLESASNYYLKAGFEEAAEYARASKYLFEAYMYMGRASRERDPEQRVRLYSVAEKILEMAAASFDRAHHPGKRTQVDRLLQKVREERRVAVSLTEVLQSPGVLASTNAFATPTPSYERAVGLERFSHAEVQARLIARRTTLAMDERLELEMELVNAGRGPAQLIKVEEMIPRGFEVVDAPGSYPIEAGYVDMRGKRLDPLRTEEVKLVLRPTVRGDFIVAARVLYLDEVGTYKSHEPEPVEIRVKG